MKITAIHATPVNIPLHAPYRFSYGSIASLTKTIVQVVTDEGITGLGECADGNRAATVSGRRWAESRGRASPLAASRAALWRAATYRATH